LVIASLPTTQDHKMKNMEINYKKELIGCFGDPIWENPTEHMIEAAFRHHDMKFRYVTTLVKKEDLESAFEGVKAMGFKGFNCTIPHKVAIIEHLDGLGESAEVMQAVNCVVERNGKYIGENTDGKGFLESLRTLTNPDGKKALLFGAGGAARAIGVELALSGASHITVVNRTEERGQSLTQLLNDKTPTTATFVKWNDDHKIPSDTEIVINCTNIGLYPNINQRVPVQKESLQSHMVVCDVIPNPPNTPFLKEAKSQGCQTLDGLGMLINQGIIGIKYWSGVEADGAVMRKALEELLF